MKNILMMVMFIASASAFAQTVVIIDCFEKATYENNSVTLGGKHIRFVQPNHSSDRSDVEDGWKLVDSNGFHSNLGKCEFDYETLESYPVIERLGNLDCSHDSGEYKVSQTLEYSTRLKKWEYVETGKEAEKQSFDTCRLSFIY